MLLAKPPPIRPPPTRAGSLHRITYATALALAGAVCFSLVMACGPAITPEEPAPTWETNAPIQERHVATFMPTPTPQVLAWAPPRNAEETMARIYQAMRIDLYKSQTRVPTHLDYLVACNWMLATTTDRQVSIHTEDATTPETTIALHLIGNHAGNDWLDFCRVEHGALGAWASVGTGKWDAAMAKYGPPPTPTSNAATEAMQAIYSDLQGATGSPSDRVIMLGCNKLLFGGGTGVIDPGTKATHDMGWLMHDRILKAAGSDWPDFCRVHGGPNGRFKSIGTGKWDAAMKDK